VRSYRGGLCWLLTLTVCSAVILAAQATALPTRRILLLHQSPIGGWVREKFDAAFVAHIRSIDAQVDLYEETLDAARFQGTEQSRLFSDYLKNKYADRKIDVIVTMGVIQLGFARENREAFGNPAIVAVVPPAGLLGHDNVTGLQGGLFINGTIDLALALRPHTKSLIVVDGGLEDKGEVKKEVERQLSERSQPLALVYLWNLPLSDVVSRVESAPERSVVLFIKQRMRTASEGIDALEGFAKVASASRVPVFSHIDTYVGAGSVGGYVWDFEADAGRLADMAVRLANGGNVTDVPPQVAAYRNLLDWQQLQRWSIPEARIPA
jgi:ABC-type uncharacterized transport system substrate-binding protein